LRSRAAWLSSVMNLGVLLLVVTGLLELIRRTPPLPDIPFSQRQTCVGRPLTLVDELYPRSTWSDSEWTIMTLPATFTAQSCVPGRWIVEARSTGTGKVPPVLNVGLEGQLWKDMVLDTPQSLSVPVSGPAELSLAFLNKSYQLELRDLKIPQVLLRGAQACIGVPGQVAVKTGSWNSASASGRLFGEGELKLQTCGAREAVIRLQGKKFHGEWPRVELRGAGQTRQIVVQRFETLRLPLKSSHVFSLKLLNPESLTTQNSQLRFRIHFLPK
jgi:hypothetical protein